MPLQNRVDPFSRIHAVEARGLFTGNRGILHDDANKTLRKQTWTTDGWVLCALEWKQQQAPIMGASHWTELFFLDEAVGLAAGHRPCMTCRRARAKAFLDATGFGRMADLSRALTAEMKPYLRARAPAPREFCTPAALPDGAFFAIGEQSYLKWQDAARRFTWTGYGPPEPLPSSAARLTPAVSLKALALGYEPVMHPSLDR
ncbi:MAG: hypothetical protein AAGJ32_06980 [Pseudomonadota bacterium]